MDIAIVGAGPAGAHAAYVLAKRGARVTIFDASHPREKPCGGGITGRALALVADAIDPAAFPQTIVRTVRLRACSASAGQVRLREGSASTGQVRLREGSASAGQVRLREGSASAGQVRLREGSASTGQARLRVPWFGGRAHGSEPVADGDAIVPLDGDALVVSSREAFDAAMLAAAERAGAVLDRSRVTGVSVDRDGASVTTTRGRHRAAFLIGADGANSLVRRRVATAFRRDQLSIATGFFAHGVTSNEIVLELTASPPGYIWSFPRPTHLAIGICAQADTDVTAASLRATTAAWIAAAAVAPGAALAPYSWPIPSLSASDLDALVPAGPRWALIGDAAGLVDPITREGIFFALASGQWIADALAADASGFDYATRVHDEAVSELARAARFKSGFFRPAFMGLMVRALRESSSIRAVMADLVAGRQSYATLKRRLLGTLEWGVALRMLAGAWATND